MIDDKFGKIDVPNHDADEPAFILCATDPLAVGVIRFYQMMRSTYPSDVELVSLDKTIETFQKWPRRKWPGSSKRVEGVR